MANSISGNAGIAGALVVAACMTLNSVNAVTADGSGNYSITGLSAGVYYVQVSLAGYNFSPFTSVQTVVASDITGVNFTATSNARPIPGAWTKHGQIITPINGNPLAGTEEPTVFYEGNAQILSPNPDGKIFKMWFADGLGIFYAESNDGLSWTRHSGAVIASKAHPRVFKNGSTYYCYYSGSGLPTAISVSTSSDGITWTLQNASAIATGIAGSWDAGSVFHLNPAYVDGGGIWHGLYDGSASTSNSTLLYAIGLCTSTDGITWTKVGTQPVIFNASGMGIQKIGSTYYVWFQGAPFVLGTGGTAPYSIPTEIYRTSSTDLLTFTDPILVFPRTLVIEGVGSNNGQVADACLIEVNGVTYFYYEGAINGAGGNGYALSCATTSQTLSSLVSTNEGINMGAFAQSNEFNNAVAAAGPFPVVYSSNNVAGNLLVCCMRVSINGVSAFPGVSIADSQNNTWTIAQNTTSGTSERFIFAYAPNCKAGPNTVTVTVTGGTTYFIQTIIAEYSGIQTATPVDQTGTKKTGSSTTASANSITTTAANELVIGWGGNDTANNLTITQGTGFTLRQTSGGNVFLEDKLAAPVAAYAPTAGLSSSVAWSMSAISFFGQAAGSGSAGWVNRQRRFVNKRG